VSVKANVSLQLKACSIRYNTKNIMTMNKILITGATGKFGTSTINFLLEKGVQAKDITAFIRDKNLGDDLITKGITLKTGDYSDYFSMVHAFKGMHKLLLISGSDVAKRTSQHENAVKAAKEAGVKHVIYTSFQRKNETSLSPVALVAEAHIKTEKWLKESGMDYTIMKNNLYMDGLPGFLGDKILENCVIFQPAGDGKTAYTLRDDMAEAAAVILTGDGHENKEYDITSDRNYSYNDIAEILSRLTGKTIKYVSPSKEEFVKTMSAAGVPVEYIGIFASFAEAIKQGEFEKTSTTLEKLIGRKPTSLESFLKKMYVNSM
jgi:NAD(P)H dehydrogenase (quinone)